jgi:hypothetical protein
MIYQFLANAVLLLHVGVVLFIVASLPLILLGGALRWRWVRNWWFRALHLLAIVVVVGQSWAGIMCPLTTLEQALRRQAGQVSYEGDFIAYWLSKLLFFQAPPWVFIVVYTIFGALVLLGMVFVRPKSLRQRSLTQS